MFIRLFVFICVLKIRYSFGGAGRGQVVETRNTLRRVLTEVFHAYRHTAYLKAEFVPTGVESAYHNAVSTSVSGLLSTQLALVCCVNR